MVKQRKPSPEPLLRVCDESMLVQLARQVAARHGDPDPELIQHAIGTREEVTRTTGSIVFSDEPSYIVVVKGKFHARSRTPPIPAGLTVPKQPEFVSYPIQVLVVNIATGEMTDSGSTHDYPNLAPLGRVATDHPAPSDASESTVDAERIASLMATSARVDEVVEVRYRGWVTVGSPGRARLHGHDGGISGLIWYALGRTGWLGHTARLKPTIELVIRVAPAPAGGRCTFLRSAPLPGGQRQMGEHGRVEHDGTVHQAYIGPLHRRASVGVRLVESERRPEDYDSFEDMLYTAAVHTGWLPAYDRPPVVGEVPEADILIRIARHRA